MDYQEIKRLVHEQTREDQIIILVLYALNEVAKNEGLTLHQRSDFHTPWGAAPTSKEEEAFQDLVWIHKVLPPNEKFDPEKAKRGYYRDLKVKVLDEFWSKYDPEQEKEIHQKRFYKPRSIHHCQRQIKKPTSLKSIRKTLAEGNHGL